MGLLNNILGVSAYWQVNKDLARKTSINCALLLSDLISKYSYFEEKEMLVEFEGDYYFFATAESIEEDTTLSYKVQKSTIEELKSHGLIKTKLMGVPAKTHFTICENNVLQMLQTSSSQKSKLDLTKSQNLYNNKNKENKNKTTTIKEVDDVPDFVKKEKEEFKQQALDYQKESNRLDAEQTKDLIRNNASLKEELIKFFTRTTLYKQADKQAHDKIRLNIRLREFFELVLDEHIARNKSEELYPRKSSESIKHFRNYFKKKIDNLSESEYRQFLKLLIS